VINEKYKSNITSESIRVALNRDNIKEEIGLVNQIDIGPNHNEIANNGMNLIK